MFDTFYMYLFLEVHCLAIRSAISSVIGLNIVAYCKTACLLHSKTKITGADFGV